MNITGTQFAYYHLCHRKLWLFSHGIRMEHSSDTVYEGKMIGSGSYAQRSDKYKEITIGGSKIDFYDAANKVVHEIKKSDKAGVAHIAQVKYYLWLLEENGITGASGLIDYPRQHKTRQVTLTDDDRSDIVEWLIDIERIVEDPVCPDVINKPICKSCSYFDFCYSDEEL